MPTPLIIVVGSAGAGKDTVAAMIAKNYGGIVVAQADIMKAFAYDAFGFTVDQLWGPSGNRNAVDTRFADEDFCLDLIDNFRNRDSRHLDWLAKIGFGNDGQVAEDLSYWATHLLSGAPAAGGLTPRKILQTLGTEFGRSLSKNVWADYARGLALKLLGGGYDYSPQYGLIVAPASNYDFVIISDGRFRNEIVGVKAMGGVAINVVAKDADGSRAEAAGIVGHRSETEQRGLPPYIFDAVIHNDKKGLEALEYQVKETVETLFPDPMHFFPVIGQ